MSVERDDITSDIASVNRIASVSRILSAVAELTGMRFAAVARVTELTWTACAVYDTLGFGLAPGDDLKLETTICNEIRQHHKPVVFGEASKHPVFSRHHTPELYGLESYVSVPIFRRNGDFFGTLCAIDLQPANLDDPVIVRSIQLFAELIGMHLEVTDALDDAQRKLGEAGIREQAVAETEREIRDLFQPIVTGLYLLRTSDSTTTQDIAIVQDMDDCCERINELLKHKLDDLYLRAEEQS